MKRFTWILPAAILALGIMIGSRSASARPGYTKKERKDCTFCHVGGWNSGMYTEAGLYYKDHDHSFKGYVAKPPK